MITIPYHLVTRDEMSYSGRIKLNIDLPNPSQARLHQAVVEMFVKARNGSGFIFIEDEENGQVHAVNTDNILRFSLGRKK